MAKTEAIEAHTVTLTHITSSKAKKLKSWKNLRQMKAFMDIKNLEFQKNKQSN